MLTTPDGRKSGGARVVLPAVLILGLIPHGRASTDREAPPATAAAQAAAEELEAALAALRRQIDDESIEPSQRASVALELAETLDRAAQNAETPDAQRQNWNQAAAVLDEFGRKHPAHLQDRTFRLQGAVYRWAVARSLRREWEQDPARSGLRGEAVAAFDDALSRFRSIPPLPAGVHDEAFDANLRFRFAQTLADRADLENEPARKSLLESQAGDLLEGMPAGFSIQGFARLLKGELLRRQGRFDAALVEVDAAARAAPAPPERQIVHVRSAILAGLKRFDEAIQAVKGSRLPDSEKRLAMVQTLLERRKALSVDADRYPIDSRLFDELSALTARPGPDSRAALLALARAGIEPDPRLGAEAWDLLADAQEAAGDPIRASGLEEKAAVRAEDSGRPERAAGYRLKEGALLFRGARFVEAAVVLSRLSRLSGPEHEAVRAKAGLLRALALGRAVATAQAGASTREYKEALETRIKDFPDDAGADEARWLLGDVLRAEGDRDRAVQLWQAISMKSARWLDSRRAIAAFDRAELERVQAAGRPDDFAARLRSAEEFLDRCIDHAPTESAANDLWLERAWLDLLPQARNSDDARRIAERVEGASITKAQRYRAGLIHILALAQSGRYVEAEKLARNLAEAPEIEDPAAFLTSVRLLDRSAAAADTDLRQRRFGLVMRILLVPALARDPSPWPPVQTAELHMRLTRGLIFLGDDHAAKASLASWKGTEAVKRWDDGLLHDLADSYERLNAHALAIDVQRLRLGAAHTGSPEWFDAKYGLALALYRSGKTGDARTIIDAAAVLHPDLGGDALKEKFIRLRRRLGNPGDRRP